MKEQLILFSFALLLFVIATGGKTQAFGWAYAGMPDPMKARVGFHNQLFEKAEKLFFQTKEEAEKFTSEFLDKVKGEVKKINEEIDKRLEKAEGQVRDGNKASDDLKTEISNLATKHRKFMETVDKQLTDMKKLGGSGGGGKVISLKQYLTEEFESQKDGTSVVQRIKDMASGKASKQQIDISLKAVGDMSSAGNLTGTYFAGYDQRPGVTVFPLFDAHLRQLFPSTSTEKPLIRYVRETTSEGGFDMVAEGAEKPQIDWDFDIVDAPVRKIAGVFRLPEEMIDDIPYLLTYITGRGLEELKNKEDQQILYGTGAGQQLSGINAIATAFAAGNLVVPSPNRFDALIAAKKQLRMLNMVPTHVLVSPEDYAGMRLLKTTTGEYIFPVLPGTDIITVDGTPIIQNNRVSYGNFFVMDVRYAEIADRMASQVRLFYHDRDNAIKNLITCVIEERLALPIYRPQAFIKGTFAAAITDLTS